MKDDILILTVPVPSAAASSVDGWIFKVPTGAEYEVAEVAEVHTVAGSDGSAVTADIVKASSGTAPGSGTSVLSSTFNLKSTANTPVVKTRGSGLAAAHATRILTSGQLLGINFTGTLTAVAGLLFTITLVRRLSPTNRN